MCDRIPHDQDSRFHGQRVVPLSQMEQAHNVELSALDTVIWLVRRATLDNEAQRAKCHDTNGSDMLTRLSTVTA